MKKIYIYIVIAALLASCEDFLELEPQNNFTVSGFFENESQLERAVAGAYVKNRAIHGRVQWKVGEFRSDNASFQDNPGVNANLGLEDMDYFIMSVGNDEVALYWSELYDGIIRCNYVLQNIDPVDFIDQRDKNIRKGEALFLRVWYYFNMVQLFGDVPYVVNTVETLDEALSEEFVERVDDDVIYDSLFNDIDQAIEFLPVEHPLEEYGRATRGAALMLKAKMHMAHNQRYDLALPVLEELNSLGYELLDDYESIFNPANKGNGEMIFEIQYSFALGQASNFISRFVPWNSGTDLLVGGENAGAGSGRNQPTKELIDLYQEGDIRKNVNIAYYVTNEGDSIPYMGKYAYPLLDRARQDVNWPMFRYADALLMLAECLNEVNGFDQNAIGILNLIRLRAGVPPYSDASPDPGLVLNGAEGLRNAIARERRLELAFENHRWFDLVRRGEAVAVMQAHGEQQKAEKGILGEQLPDGTSGIIPAQAFTNIRTVFPIPERQVVQFGYTQNEAWQ